MAVLTTLNAASPLNADDGTYLTFTVDVVETLNAALDDTDADFATMDTLSFNVQYRLSAALTDDTYGLSIRIVNGATILAAADAGGTFQSVAQGITTTTDVNSGVVSFTYVNTAANKATWDGASVELRQDYAKTKGADGVAVQVDIVTFDGTYTAGAAGVTETPVTGSASYSGQPVTTKDDLLEIPPVGSMSYTGQAATETTGGGGLTFSIINAVSPGAVADPTRTTLGFTPTEGNLLVAVCTERSSSIDTTFTCTDNGASTPAWDKQLELCHRVEGSELESRVSMAVFTRLAVASGNEATYVDIDNGTANTKFSRVFEIEASAAYGYNNPIGASAYSGAAHIDGLTTAAAVTTGDDILEIAIVGMRLPPTNNLPTLAGITFDAPHTTNKSGVLLGNNSHGIVHAINGTSSAAGSKTATVNADGNATYPNSTEGIVAILTFEGDAAGATEIPTAGSVSYTGLSVTSAVDITEIPAVGSTSYSGLSVGSTVSITETPTTGSVSYSGQPAVTLEDLLEIPVTGSMSYTGLSVSTAVDVTEAPVTGSMAYSGLSVSASIDLLVVPATGSVSYSGQTLGTKEDRSEIPEVGSTSYSGLSVSTTADVTEEPSVGSVSYSGLSVSTKDDLLVVPTAGSVSYSGQTLGTKEDHSETPTVVSMSYSGQTLGTKEDRSEIPVTGSVSYTGRSVLELIAGAEVPAVGSVSYTGLSVSADLSEVPVVGSMSYSGLPLSALIAVTEVPTVGLMSYAGLSVSDRTDVIVIPSVVGVTLTGQNVFESGLIIEQPLTGSVSLSGGALNARAAEVPPAYSMALTGRPVDSQEDLFEFPTSGVLTLTGRPVTDGSNVTEQPVNGSILMTGQGVSERLDVVEAVGASSIILFGGGVVTPVPRGTLVYAGFSVDDLLVSTDTPTSGSMSYSGQLVDSVGATVETAGSYTFALVGRNVQTPITTAQIRKLRMQTFFEAASGNVTSPLVRVSGDYRGATRSVLVEISVAASVSIQGRAKDTTAWQTLATITTTGVTLVKPLPQMQAVLTGNTGTVSAHIDAL